MTVTQPFDEHLLVLWTEQNLFTPAFVYDETAIVNNLQTVADITEGTRCRVLYSVKALSYPSVLALIRPYVSGFSVSSVFEGRLAREIAGHGQSIHLSSPGIRPADFEYINRCCDYLSFNSLSQFQNYRQLAKTRHNGLRVNPGRSFVKDQRYDPCRPFSKLGVPMSQLPDIDDPVWSDGVDGLLIHNNCESTDYRELLETLEHIAADRPDLPERLSWLNLGGGYLFAQATDRTELRSFLGDFSSRYDLQLFMEPGKAVVGNAGYLVASVIDLFESDGRNIAILDTSVNHLPEVFEYQYQPAVLEDSVNGQYSYRLAGSSCLSGDIFGDYRFNRPLKTGSRVIFRNVGAYMMVKANMFNGINLPTVYCLDQSGGLEMQRQYEYADFRGILSTD